jgi:hypothetical protein
VALPRRSIYKANSGTLTVSNSTFSGNGAGNAEGGDTADGGFGGALWGPPP